MMSRPRLDGMARCRQAPGRMCRKLIQHMSVEPLRIESVVDRVYASRPQADPGRGAPARQRGCGRRRWPRSSGSRGRRCARLSGGWRPRASSSFARTAASRSPTSRGGRPRCLRGAARARARRSAACRGAPTPRLELKRMRSAIHRRSGAAEGGQGSSRGEPRVPPRAGPRVRERIPGPARRGSLGAGHRSGDLRAAGRGARPALAEPPSTRRSPRAVEGGDADLAERLTREHIGSALGRMLGG